MQKIGLSAIQSLPFDFDAAVRGFLQAKKEHLATEGVPAPTAHPLVEAAVKRVQSEIALDKDGKPLPNTIPDDFVADYEIVDDIPKLTVEQKRSNIVAKVRADADTALEKVMPPLKARLWGILVSEAMAVPPEDRSAEQLALLEEHQQKGEKSKAFTRHLAELESQIHDLPEDMLDIWKPAPFPE